MFPSFAADLAERAKARGPIVVGLVGAGQMGTDLIVQIALMRGIRVGEFADTLFRAAAFARVTAAGRAHRDHGEGSSYRSDISASRLMSMADQLETAARMELEGRLA